MWKLCPPRQLRLLKAQTWLHLARKKGLHIGMNTSSLSLNAKRWEEGGVCELIFMWLLNAHSALKGYIESIHMMNLLWGFVLVGGAQKEWNKTFNAMIPDFCGVQWEGCLQGQRMIPCRSWE